MATHEITRNISGLARALAQQGLMTEQDAETLQSQAQSAGVSFVEQVLAAKRMSALQLAVFASRAFGVPLFASNLSPPNAQAGSVPAFHGFVASLSLSLD